MRPVPPAVTAGDTTEYSLLGATGRAVRSPLLPAVGAFVAVGVAVAILEPSSLTYVGSNLLLTYTVPLGLASLAQMLVMSVGDIDLGIGAFIGLVNAMSVTLLERQTAVGVLALVVSIAAYIAMGLLIEVRRLPSLIVTLGASFVWAGAAIVILPTPGGTAPSWLGTAVNYQLPIVPLPVAVLVVAGLACSFFMASPFGVVLRAVGSGRRAVQNAGLSVLRTRAAAYAIAGLIGVLAGLIITGDITSGDSTVSSSYTLLSIAAVILGGGDFSGGRVFSIGTVLGAATLSLLASLLTFVNIPSNYQVGVEGLMLLVVLLIRWARNISRHTA